MQNGKAGMFCRTCGGVIGRPFPVKELIGQLALAWALPGGHPAFVGRQWAEGAAVRVLPGGPGTAFPRRVRGGRGGHARHGPRQVDAVKCLSPVQNYIFGTEGGPAGAVPGMRLPGPPEPHTGISLPTAGTLGYRPSSSAMPCTSVHA